MKSRHILTTLLCVLFGTVSAFSADDHLVFEPEKDANGKHVVILTGDEEYRSEESGPMLGQILAREGFKATVLFSIGADGNVNPDQGDSLSNSAALDSADAIIMALRFRHWGDEAMQRFQNAVDRGVPLIALRTSTHPFNFPADSKWAKYNWKGQEEGSAWEGGFGENVLGETWVSHWGKHKKEACRTYPEKGQEKHPLLNGVGQIFCTSDVYEAYPKDPSTIILRGEVTESFDPKSKGATHEKKNAKGETQSVNNPMQPVVWTREFDNGGDKNNRIVTNTMGAASDLADENLRRLVINSVYWGLEMEVPAKVNVDVKGYNPSFYSFKAYKVGLKPKDFIPGAPAFANAKFLNEVNKPAPKKKPAPAKKPAPKKAEAPKKKLPPGVLEPMNPESVPFKAAAAPKALKVGKGDNIVILGSGMGSRMGHFGHFETELYSRYPSHDLTIRNMADEGNTPGFRPHPGREQDGQYAFPGAKELLPKELQAASKPAGHYETPDQWLTRLSADTIVAFFGFNSSFGGPEDLARFRGEFEAFVQHTLSQKYNGKSIPQLAVVSPTAYQDITAEWSVPDGKTENANIQLYSKAMQEICAANGALFVDAFTPSQSALSGSDTIDGALLNSGGYQKLAPILADGVFGKADAKAKGSRDDIHAAVQDKNWAWLNDYKMPNGVHVFGRRYNPYGPDNYPHEIKKTREYTVNRDQAIWATAQGKSFDLAKADSKTSVLPPVETNYKVPADNQKNGTLDYTPGRIVEMGIEVPEGYQIDLFASEETFPDLKNPVQMAFDNKGRLWVATMESYPHYRIGDPKPKDKLLILEDTDGNGYADTQTIFADDLHIPIGFEISHDGVYVSQSGSLVLLKDLDGDDSYDTKEILLSGFDDHDTHHAISAFCADPSGAFVMCEGVFLHSNTESAYGPSRGTNGGFYRYSPQRKQILRYSQYAIPNPWGLAFDDYGQDFFLHTSGTKYSWMLPGSVKTRYGANMAAPDLITSNSVRPTSGVEFMSSRHFPDEVQGDVIINNNIGFLGAKQHKMVEDGTGYTTEYRQDLFMSEDRNFRPTDLEFAPDGSLYIVDWHNALIGHMQHNARDPHRDHSHGRVYRLTYPSRPLVKPPKVHGASISELLENLKLHEYRARYRTKRELRKHDGATVAKAAAAWAKKQKDERHQLEALWVTWGADHVDADLLGKLLKSKDHRIRAAAVRVARFNEHKLDNLAEIVETAAKDDHGRVRLEAIVAASYLPTEKGAAILAIAKEKGVDDHMRDSVKFANDLFSGAAVEFTDRKAKPLPKGVVKDTPNLTKVQVNCVYEGIKFDVKSFQVEAGKKIELLFNNPDVMQHNLLIVKPGTADKVAADAMALGAAGFDKQWVPAGDDVLVASKLLNSKQKETLTFSLPTPGTYQFVCTFPGHATMMRGEIVVVPAKQASAPAPKKAKVATIAPAAQAGDWQHLTLDHWRNYQSDTVSDKWIEDDGVITLTGRGGGDIITKEQYEAFEIVLEYQISKGGNSGLMFHVQESEKKAWQTGPEIQIQDHLNGKDAQKAGWLYQLYQAETDASKPFGHWNEFRLKVTPEKNEHWVNGVKYFEYQKGGEEWNKRVAASKFVKFPKFGKPTKGHICLQDHTDVVAFRNIKIRSL